MSTKAETVLWIAAGFVILVLLYLVQKKTGEIKELKAQIDESKELTHDVRHRLLDLLKSNRDIDPQVAQELTQICALLEIQQDTKAILSLAKIIEKLLRELYQDDPDLLARKKTPSFADYLEHARDKEVISKEDFHLISVLRLIRNEEAHELAIKKEHSRIVAVFIAGIAFVLTLSRLLRKKLGGVAPAV
jgi:ribonuclease HII